MKRRHSETLTLAVGVTLIVAGCILGCAPLWTPQDTARVALDEREQMACLDAGSYGDYRACRCKVRQSFPEGPQCLPDGGGP